MPWFHGGIPGLDIGDELLPPTCSGVDLRRKYGEAEGATEDQRRVFISRDPRHAATYAYSYPHGDVYEVEPLGRRGRDRDILIAGLSGWCERARVVRVTRRDVRLIGGRLTR